MGVELILLYSEELIIDRQIKVSFCRSIYVCFGQQGYVSMFFLSFYLREIGMISGPFGISPAAPRYG